MKSWLASLVSVHPFADVWKLCPRRFPFARSSDCWALPAFRNPSLENCFPTQAPEGLKDHSPSNTGLERRASAGESTLEVNDAKNSVVCFPNLYPSRITDQERKLGMGYIQKPSRKKRGEEEKRKRKRNQMAKKMNSGPSLGH